MARRWGALLAALVVLAIPARASAVPYVTADGHTIEVVAPNLPADAARDQSFVDVLGSLVHGIELSGLRVHLSATQAELSQNCGGSPTVRGCVNGGTMFLAGWRTAQEQRTTIAHEYGHVIQTSRGNPPRGTLSDGTKRWASYEGICQGLRSGQYGDFDYLKTPREANAHAYATLNFPETEWLFDESLRPDAGALEAIRQDVLEPWIATRQAVEGKLTKRRKRSTHDLPLPVDGPLIVKLKTAKQLDAKLTFRAGERKVV